MNRKVALISTIIIALGLLGQLGGLAISDPDHWLNCNSHDLI